MWISRPGGQFRSQIDVGSPTWRPRLPMFVGTGPGPRAQACSGPFIMASGSSRGDFYSRGWHRMLLVVGNGTPERLESDVAGGWHRMLLVVGIGSRPGTRPGTRTRDPGPWDPAQGPRTLGPGPGTLGPWAQGPRSVTYVNMGPGPMGPMGPLGPLGPPWAPLGPPGPPRAPQGPPEAGEAIPDISGKSRFRTRPRVRPDPRPDPLVEAFEAGFWSKKWMSGIGWGVWSTGQKWKRRHM